jgi:hypothetical protein
MRSLGLVIGLLLFGISVSAGEESGIFGVVQDSSGHLLPGAEIQVQSESTGARWRTQSDANGEYSVAGLPPGQYKLTVRLPSFRTVSRVGAVLDAEKGLSIDFAMDLLALREAITVVSGRDEVDPSNGDRLLVTRSRPGATLPTNGPDYRMLFDLMPGVVVTPAGVSDGGQFTSNGQRPNANGFRVDGVSANTGVGGSTLPGSFPGASLPAMSASGSTDNLGSSETTQSVELRTSFFAPESGGRLGAEALVTTRSGSNAFRGEFFGHLRDNSWNARDWFANSYGLAYPRPSYRDLGGVFGGPIWRNRTFFFLSVENSQLKDSGLELTSVPSLATRQNAPAQLQALLASFPLPTGPDLGGGEAEGLVGLGRTATLGSYSARIDQALGSWGTFFARYVRAPSSSYSTQINASQGISDWRSTTLGITAGRSHVIHEIRLNYSRADFRSTYADNPWGSAFPLAGLWPSAQSGGIWQIWQSITSLLPQSANSASVWGVSVPDLGQFISGEYGKSRQDQWQLADTISIQVKRHQLRVGLDYVRLKPSRDSALTSILGRAASLQGLFEGDPLAVTISQSPQFGGTTRSASVFAQDTVHVNERLNIIYGIRWEVTPPTATQMQIPTLSGLWTGSAWTTTHTGNINGTATWPMRYGQFAPRIGLAYRLPGSGVVLRTGGGMFYDTTLGASVNPINGAPFNSWLLPAGATGIEDSVAGSNPTGPLQQGPLTPDVRQFLSGPYPSLRLPVSYQWKVSLEKGFGSRGVGSVGYLGSASRNLLGNEVYIEPDTGILDRGVTMTQNSSNYQALQSRYSGSLRRNVYVSASYTWSHCIDDGSSDSSIFLIHPDYQLSEARASCNFDVRHAATTALSYQVPRSTSSTHLPEWLSGWTISGIFRARSGFPIDIVSNEQALGQDFDNVGRPNLVPGEPIWITDASVAGNRRLNPAAFIVPPAGQQGTLGRNAIYGNGLAQVDASLRREFELLRGISLEIGLNIFNVLNHPAFADPVGSLSSPLFGQSTSMQNLMLGSGTPNTGLPPMFQTGGSRSAELSFRISF